MQHVESVKVSADGWSSGQVGHGNRSASFKRKANVYSGLMLSPLKPLLCVALLSPFAESASTGRPETVPQSRLAAQGASGFSQFAPRAVAELRDHVSFANWLRDHPADKGERYQRYRGDGTDDEDFGRWCARATAEQGLGQGPSSLRVAYFYPPEVPAKPEFGLPPASTDLVQTECTLGAIRVSSGGIFDSATATAVADALNQMFGESQPWDEQFGVMGRGTRIWHAGSATIALGQHLSYPGVAVIGFFPFSKATLGNRFVEYAEAATRITVESTRELLASVGAGQDIITRIEHSLESFDEYHNSKTGCPDFGLKQELLELLQASSKGSPDHRAGYLLAVHVILRGGEGHACVIPQNELRPENKNHYLWNAVEFAPHYDEGATYDGNLVNMAMNLDPAGHAGKLAFVMLLEEGMDATRPCDGRHQFEDVLREGEKFLAGSTDRELNARTHFAVALAYEDIVAMAEGVGAQYEAGDPPSSFVSRASDARMKVLEHFRMSIELAHDSQPAPLVLRRHMSGEETLRKEAWREAWWLRAKLPPRQITFLCVWD